METLLELIALHSLSEKKAHIYRNQILSYKELHEQSNALACFLREKLADDKRPVVVLGHKHQLMLVCFLASVKSGRPYIPIDISLPSQRIHDIVGDSHCPVILAVEGEELLQGETPEIINHAALQEIIGEYKSHVYDQSWQVLPDDPFYIIYTSGSTGKPKGVIVTYGNVNAFVAWSRNLCQCDGSAVFLNQAPFSFDLSVMDLYTALATGSILFSIDKGAIENLRELLSLCKDSGITHWVSTPSFIDLCFSTAHFNATLLPNLQVTLFCGEILSQNTAQKIRTRFPDTEIINLYGPTEATVAITAVTITDTMVSDSEPLPVGYCKDDCLLEISGAETEGDKGEIIIFGESVARGYYNNPELSAQKFITKEFDGKILRGYKTGDKGYVKDGLLNYCGRNDFQIKLNGFRIEIEDIENNLRACPNVKNAVVLPKIVDNKVLSLVSFVSLEQGGSDREQASIRVRQELAKKVPQYMIPRKIMVIDNLPMNANGKVNRKELLEALADGSI